MDMHKQKTTEQVSHMLVRNLIIYVFTSDLEYITVSDRWCVYQWIEQLIVNEVFSILNIIYSIS
jgi:hypothetical protein